MAMELHLLVFANDDGLQGRRRTGIVLYFGAQPVWRFVPALIWCLSGNPSDGWSDHDAAPANTPWHSSRWGLSGRR